MTTSLTTQQVEFRGAMSQLSAAVNVVTSDGPGGRVGLTISAVCSVTDCPPTLLVCVNQSSYTHDVFRQNRAVCINVLGAGHEDVALDFAGARGATMDERFARNGWSEHRGQPVLADAAASIIGRVVSETVHGSHTVMFVEVDEILRSETSGGLVYYRRAFHPLHA